MQMIIVKYNTTDGEYNISFGDYKVTDVAHAFTNGGINITNVN